MNNEPDVVPSSARKRPFILFRLWQWLVAAVFALTAVALLAKLDKLALPGAPNALFWIALAVTLIVAVLHTVPVFFRLPPIGILAAYGLTLPAFMLSGTALEKLQSAYERTPEGAKAKEARLASERAAAERDARDAAQSARAESEALEAQNQAEQDKKDREMCDLLIDQVVDGVKVFEINDVSIIPSSEPGEILTCTGEAITSSGRRRIELGLVKTPQGKPLVSVRYP
jgi:hypothetical protein